MTAATKATEYPSAVAKGPICAGVAKKARRAIDLVRGRSVISALDILRWAPQIASGPVASDREVRRPARKRWLDWTATLVVATVYADRGPTAKRIRPRAQGPRVPHPPAH